MKLRSSFFLAISALSLAALPAMADSFVTFSTPTAAYTGITMNYGGGDGSGNIITSLGPFGLTPVAELSVPSTFPSWNSPPAVESSTPNVLNSGGVGLALTLTGAFNVIGFELQQSACCASHVTASFYNGATLIDTIDLSPSANGGALLYALQDTSPGASINSVVIFAPLADDLSIAQLRAGLVPTVPEPSSLVLLGTGLAGVISAALRRSRPSA